MTRRQRRVMELLKDSFERVKGEYEEVVKEASLTAKHVIAVAFAESSLGADERLCSTRRGGIFQLYSAAAKEAKNYAIRFGKDVEALDRARWAVQNPECEEGLISLSFLEDVIDDMLREFLAYLGALLSFQKKFIPDLPISKFYRLMLLYHVGPCAKSIKGAPSKAWNEQANRCLKEHGAAPVATPYEYYRRLLKGMWLQEGFFRG